ncbi:hypothetical protein, partial [Escherichia coli]|uniref:hypothetical protein n=1 Tax=Escherichia coli TaxID=562 RepID=UPI0015C06844
ELAGQAQADVFALGVVHDVFGLDHFARHVVEIAKAIGQAQVTACWPLQTRPLKVSGDSLSRSPRPFLTTAMNWLWISPSMP